MPALIMQPRLYSQLRMYHSFPQCNAEEASMALMNGCFASFELKGRLTVVPSSDQCVRYKRVGAKELNEAAQ